jgi:hypothetical protein
MTARSICPTALVPLEDYAGALDNLFSHVAQRRGLRTYLQRKSRPRANLVLSRGSATR